MTWHRICPAVGVFDALRDQHTNVFMYRLTPASSCVTGYNRGGHHSYHPQALTHEEDWVNQFVAIPLNNGDLWNSLSTYPGPHPGKYK